MKTPHYLLIAAMVLCSNTAMAQQDKLIQFKRGYSSATLTDQVKGDNRTYVFYARQGQKATITLTPVGGDKGQLAFSVYSYCGEEFGEPLADQSLNWRGILPCTDKYSIDVSPSDNAMKNNYRLKYSLKVKIQ